MVVIRTINEILKTLTDIESGNAIDAIEGVKRVAQYNLPDEQIQILIKIPINGKKLNNKEAATYALSSIVNNDKCVNTLIDLLDSSKSHEEIRGHAAEEGLGMEPMPNKQLREKTEKVLIGSLNDPSPIVRFWHECMVDFVRRSISPMVKPRKFRESLSCPGQMLIFRRMSCCLGCL